MSTGAIYYESDIDRIETDIASYRGSRDYWTSVETTADDRAADCRRVASAIRANTDPLSTVLQPVFDLHTTHTWEGNAATQSRNRLDIHSERATGAITTLRGLATDLEAEAAVAALRADTAAQEVANYAWKITMAQDDLQAARHSV